MQERFCGSRVRRIRRRFNSSETDGKWVAARALVHVRISKTGRWIAVGKTTDNCVVLGPGTNLSKTTHQHQYTARQYNIKPYHSRESTNASKRSQLYTIQIALLAEEIFSHLSTWPKVLLSYRKALLYVKTTTRKSFAVDPFRTSARACHPAVVEWFWVK